MNGGLGGSVRTQHWWAPIICLVFPPWESQAWGAGGGGRRRGLGLEGSTQCSLVSAKLSLKGSSPQPNLLWTVFKGYDHFLIYFIVSEELS